MNIKSNSFKSAFFAVLAIFLLNGCAETEFLTQLLKPGTWENDNDSYVVSRKGSYKVGTPYKIGNIRYYPKEDFSLVETGIASWYGPGFHADLTANGETFDQHALTAAHRTLQLPCFARVTNLENGKSVIVRVNDRGPFKSGRVMDVSKRAAELLDFVEKGTARIRLQVLERESRVLAKLAKSGKNTTLMTYNDVRDMLNGTNDLKVAAKPKTKYVAKPKPRLAYNDIPESLMTPTITVEALKDDGNPVEQVTYKENISATLPMKSRISRTYNSSGEVTQGPVVKTGIFVQAGSFIFYNNAEAMAKELVDIAPTVIEPVTTRSGQKMYRVKLGPIDNVANADNVLSRVIQSGASTALIIGKNKKK